MSFLNILFLAGMVGVAGPVLAHLLARPRFKRIPFTMMQFLEKGQLESQRRRRIRNLLVMLLRCAIITCIVLGFAGPLTEKPVAATGDTTHFAMGLDDSLSLAYGDRFNEIRDRVKAVIAESPANAQIDLVGLASGERIQDASPEAAAAFVDTLRPVPAPAQLSRLLSLIRTENDETSADRVVLASDFTPQILAQTRSIPKPFAVSRYEVIAPDPSAPVKNLHILEVQTTATGRDQLRFSVSVRNQSEETQSLTVEATLASDVLATTPVEIAPGRTQSVPLNVTIPDLQRQSAPITLSLRCDDGLDADNHYYLGVQYPENSEEHVLIVCNDEREAFLTKTALETLGEMMPHMQFNVQTMSYDTLNDISFLAADSIIVTAVAGPLQSATEKLGRFLEGGGRLVTFAHRTQNADTLAALYAQKILPALPGALQQQAVVLASAVGDVGIGGNPTALRALENYQIDQYVFDAWYNCEAAADSVTQWPLESGDALLYHAPVGSGETFFLNTSADDSLSGFMKSPAALPLLSYLLADDDPLQTAAGHADEAQSWPRLQQTISTPIQIVSPNGLRSSAQSEKGVLNTPPLFELGMVTAELDPPVYLGLNVPEGETDLSLATQAAIDGAVARLFIETNIQASEAADNTSGTDQTHYGSWALAAALGFLLLETLITNRMVR